MQLTESGFRNSAGVVRSRTVALSGVLGLAFLTFVASVTWAFEDSKSDNGLRGILPDEVPAGLAEDDFASLDGAWAGWSQGVAAEVAKLYNPEVTSVAAQREVLQTLRIKLDVMARSLADPRYQSLADPLTSLYGGLLRRVDVAEAILNTLELDPAASQTARLADARQEVVDAVAQLKEYLQPIKNGDAWLDYVNASEVSRLMSDSKSPESSLSVLAAVQSKIQKKDQLQSEVQKQFLNRTQFSGLEKAIANYVKVARETSKPLDMAQLRDALAKLAGSLEDFETTNSSTAAASVRESFNAVRNSAPDGGATVSVALQSHYFNYNLRVVASEGFINRITSEDRTDEGPVDDFILGAKVYGQQVTKTKVGIRLKPSSTGARFDITLNGNVQSSTQGLTDQATVFTSGYHNFLAAKQVDFDGTNFSTRPARITVNANNNTTGAVTNYSNMPLFGGIADNIAIREARKRRAESEAIAQQRVSSQVVPKFNTEVDKQFVDANAKLRSDVDKPLNELNVYPSAKSFRTTDDELWVSTRLMSVGELGGGSPNSHVSAPKGVVVHLHESLLNNGADRLQLAGRTMTEDELKSEVEKFFSTLLQRDVKLSGDEKKPESKEPTTFIFAASDAIRFQAENGELTLVIRTGLKQEGEEDIPTQVITVPLSLKVDGKNIVIERGAVSVAPAQRPSSVAKQIVFAGIARKKIESAIETRKLDAQISINRDKKDPLKAAVREIKSLDGWLSIAVE